MSSDDPRDSIYRNSTKTVREKLRKFRYIHMPHAKSWNEVIERLVNYAEKKLQESEDKRIAARMKLKAEQEAEKKKEQEAEEDA